MALAEADPELAGLVQKELKRQVSGIELIASENFTSRAVMECLGSVCTNKYAEGLPGNRYYGGNEVIDQIERLCQKRALEAFNLDPAKWGVNVQPYSGSPANFAALTALLNPHDRMMGLDLPCGGHLTHGFYTATGKRVSATSVYFESLPYRTDAEGLIDFADLENTAVRYRPKLIIAGGSAYPRDWDYVKYRQICDAVGAKLLVDMSHFSGFVATKEHRNPFDYAEVVTTTTHKTLRGPRSGLVFFRKDVQVDGVGLEEKVNWAVFPALQGGPHEHQIAAVATQLREATLPEFKEYMIQVRSNARALAGELQRLGYKLVSDGTDNHLVMWNLRPQGITGSKIERLLDRCHITVNKNTVPGDKSALTPGGVRLGAPAMTTRGLKEADFVKVAQFLDKGVKIGLALQKPKQKLTEFDALLVGNADVAALEAEAMEFAKKFPYPGLANPYPLQ